MKIDFQNVVCDNLANNFNFFIYEPSGFYCQKVY